MSFAGREEAGKVIKRVRDSFVAVGISWIPEERERLLEEFIGEVLVWSRKVHLVGKRNLFENVCNQLGDSLILLEIVKRRMGIDSLSVAGIRGGKVLRVGDIGSGAGFPGLVWKLVEPEAWITLFERRVSPAQFLMRTTRLLGLRNLEVVEMDVEVLARCGEGGEERVSGDGREKFKAAYDIVLAKASGELSKLLPAAFELLSDGGEFVTFKSKKRFDEWKLLAEGLDGFEMAQVVEAPMNRGLVLFFKKKG